MKYETLKIHSLKMWNVSFLPIYQYVHIVWYILNHFSAFSLGFPLALLQKYSLWVGIDEVGMTNQVFFVIR
jgi:hypothetical protein